MTMKLSLRLLVCLLAVLMAAPPSLLAQQPAAAPTFKQEELDQLLAPIALYPDSLISQILMASTYPLEVVDASRFAQQNKNLKGDALTKALEAKSWDPSVKSLVNFPQVLSMMDSKLDWTQKLGDVFLAQQKAVMDTIQSLRAKAQAAGNLKTTTEQRIIVEEKIIKIEPVSPTVVYVPVYNPTIVYGPWWYPAYPPYYYYPPGYVASSMFWFGAGVAYGAAWGYAWGGCDYHGGSIKIDNSQNININNNINRNVSNLPANGKGNWQHNAEHRKGVGYRDQTTAERFGKGTANNAAKSREAYRGKAEQGRQNLARENQAGAGGGNRVNVSDRSGDRGGAGQLSNGGNQRGGGAFDGIDRGGNSAKTASQRGNASRSSSGGSRSRSGGGGGRR